MTILVIIAIVLIALYLIAELSDKTDSVEGAEDVTSKPVTPPQEPVIIPDNPRNDLSEIEINDDFRAALELIEEQNENVYVTGKAGTGKSTFLKYLRATTRKNVVVLAPTGLSAINVGGQTIHSFFGLPPKLINMRDVRPSKKCRPVSEA
jgi:Cdc6-like AAA superfamily ATPase